MEYDLISTKRHEQALESLDKNEWNNRSIICWLKMAFDRLFPPDPIQATAKLIKIGQKSGVSYIKIIDDRITGIDLGANTGSLPNKTKIGKGRKTTVEVKY